MILLAMLTEVDWDPLEGNDHMKEADNIKKIKETEDQIRYITMMFHKTMRNANERLEHIRKDSIGYAVDYGNINTGKQLFLIRFLLLEGNF